MEMVDRINSAFDEAFSGYDSIHGIVFDLAFAEVEIDESVFDEAFCIPANRNRCSPNPSVFDSEIQTRYQSIFDEAFEAEIAAGKRSYYLTLKNDHSCDEPQPKKLLSSRNLSDSQVYRSALHDSSHYAKSHKKSMLISSINELGQSNQKSSNKKANCDFPPKSNLYKQHPSFEIYNDEKVISERMQAKDSKPGPTHPIELFCSSQSESEEVNEKQPSLLHGSVMYESPIIESIETANKANKRSADESTDLFELDLDSPNTSDQPQSNGMDDPKSLEDCPITLSSSITATSSNNLNKEFDHEEFQPDTPPINDNCLKPQSISHGLMRKKRLRVDKAVNIEINPKYRKGIWIMCCRSGCNKWRYIKNIDDPKVVPDFWECSMNEDKNHNSCEHPEDPENQSLQYVPGEYVVGTIKWVKVPNFPTWPAIIDDDPDSRTSVWLPEQEVDGVFKCHVRFFGSLDGCFTRSWVSVDQMEHFKGTETISKFKKLQLEDDTYANLRVAISEAKKALKMPIDERRINYCSLFGRKNISK